MTATLASLTPHWKCSRTEDLPGSTGCNDFFIFSTTVDTIEHTLQDLNKKNMNQLLARYT